MNEVAHNLWIGGLPEARDHEGVVFDCLAMCVSGIIPFPGVNFWGYGFQDDVVTPSILEKAVSLAQKVTEWRGEGLKVLVTCSYGQNRSAFVAGLAMKMAGDCGGDAETIIAQIRKRREFRRGEVHALDNFSFCEHIRSYTP